MAKVRVGYGTDFVVENELVGIKTDTPSVQAHVFGNIKAEGFNAGISTVNIFDGYLDNVTSIDRSIDLNFESNSLSDEIIIDGDVTVSAGTTLTSSKENITVTDNFILPGVNDDEPTVGTMRFNDNLGSLEFYTGVEWRAVNSYVDNGIGGGRGVWMGGGDPGSTDYMDYVELTRESDAITFGTLAALTSQNAGCSSSTRGVMHGGSPGAVNTMQYITIASTGNPLDFGDLTTACRMAGSCSSSTRGIVTGGYSEPTSDEVNVIQYFEISTLGNSLDFGDLMVARRVHEGTCSSTTRGVSSSGWGDNNTSGYQNVMDYITISSKGNAMYFGDATFHGGYRAACSNQTRGVYFRGYNQSMEATNSIDYITIATTGNAVDFGDAAEKSYGAGGNANHIRGVFAGGSGALSHMEYVQFTTTGRTYHFGNLTEGRAYIGTASNAHGGLGGF